MRNKLAVASLLLAASSMLSPALRAGEPSRFDLGGAVIGGLGTLQGDGGMRNGLNINGGWTMSISDSSRSRLRIGLGINQFFGTNQPGITSDGTAEAGQVKTSLTSYQVSSDLMLPMGNSKFTYILGLTLNKYSYKTSGADAGVYSSLGIDNGTFDSTTGLRSGDANGSGTWPGLKLGFRMGLEYDFTDHVALNALYQQTEFGRNDAYPRYQRSLNPGWLQVGVKYTF